MIIFKDIISGDEMFTDSLVMIENNGMIEIETKKVSESAGIDDALIGGNASAEEASEGAEDASKTDFDIAIQNRLVQMPGFDKKGYMAYIKGYLKAVTKKMAEMGKTEEDIARFKTQSQENVKRILKNIAECDVYCGESMNAEGMLAVVDYREDGCTPFFQFFADGLEEEKA